MTDLATWLRAQLDGDQEPGTIAAAHRAILEMHRDDGLGWCTSCGAMTLDDHDRAPVETPCDTLRALASAYTGRLGDLRCPIISPYAQIEIKKMMPVWVPGLERRPKDAEDIELITAALHRT